jgi:putative transposase
MPDKKQKPLAEQIALFRYGIIAPVLHDKTLKQTRYFKRMARKEFDVPGHGLKKYFWKTFKAWLRNYRRHGFDGLKPKPRADKGVPRIIDTHLDNVIRQKFNEFPLVNTAALYRILVDEGHILHGIPSENTVRNYINRFQLKPSAEAEPQARKKFETPHINHLWLSDFMHGDKLLIDGVRRRIFLCGIIDDHSRFLVGCRWTLKENTEALELVLKDALLTYGLPQKLYCDNGAVYSSHHLQVVCARLGVALIHSKPYDSPARGKIERFWRTVREGFLALISPLKKYTLEGFNQTFAEWLNQRYHRQIHHSINQTPLDRYLDDCKQTPVRRLSEAEIDQVFYQTYQRTVKNDATVSVNSLLFEVPPRYIGTKVELRHPTGDAMNLWLYENEKPLFKLHPVDLVRNSQSPLHGIRFADSHNSEDSSC